ncbi:hypothetical protein [Agromyces sp. NPDC058126]|uniref:hypothetical protein n=1 Tax=Agromyces sp. NPDC058126 TaxID=3346350 RepID=UPI0036DC65CC
MGNLGNYQTMTWLAKKVGGPVILTGVTMFTGWAIGRTAELGGKWTFARAKAAMTNRSVPCASQGQMFAIMADAEAGGGFTLKAGDRFRVLECDGDAVLIEVIGDTDNPYVVSGELLAAFSDFPGQDAV